MSRQIILNYVLGTQGWPWAAWRHPDSQVTRVTELDYYLQQVRLAECGCFDTIFLVDHLALFRGPDAPMFWTLDPILLVTALAAHTTEIGFIPTVGTSYSAPYSLARSLASLDHIAKGRAGWNVVTSASDDAASNFGELETPASDIRYRKASALLEGAIELWHAWETDAVPADKTSARLVDADKISAINYHSQDYQVRGPLSMPRSPQTVPLICQAGPSPRGRNLAAHYADLVYGSCNGLDEYRSYREDLRARASAAGRSPDSIKLLSSVTPFVKSTEAEARRFHRELMELAPPPKQLAEISEVLDFDIKEDRLDATVPAEYLKLSQHHWPWIATAKLIDPLTEAGPVTWRDLGHAVAGRHEHHVLVGTPEHIAERIILGFEQEAFDGVSVRAPLVPSSLTDFVDHVVPILQSRDVHKREYKPGTLRERLGLPFALPVNRSRWSQYYST